SIEVVIVGLVHNSHTAASNDVDNVIFPDLCGQIGSHDVPGPNRGSFPLVARHFAKTPGKRVSASLSRRPKTPAIVLRTASGRNFNGNVAVPAAVRRASLTAAPRARTPSAQPARCRRYSPTANGNDHDGCRQNAARPPSLRPLRQFSVISAV